MKMSSSNFLALATVGLLTISAPVNAQIIYEGFAYTNGESIVGKNGGTGFGNNTWSTVSTAATVVGGLTFGSLQTSGNALQVVSSVSPSTFAEVKRTLDLTPTPSGTVWYSFLYNVDAFTGAGGTGARAGLQNGGNNVNEFYARPGLNASLNEFAGGVVTNTAANFTQSLDTTYMAIAKFTNVGLANTSGRIWALNSTNFNNFISGGATEVALDANNLAAANLTTEAAGAFIATGDVYRFAVFNGTGSATYVFDELRYGTTLGSVTPIPEPSTVALLAGALAMLAVARRHRATKV